MIREELKPQNQNQISRSSSEQEAELEGQHSKKIFIYKRAIDKVCGLNLKLCLWFLNSVVRPSNLIKIQFHTKQQKPQLLKEEIYNFVTPTDSHTDGLKLDEFEAVYSQDSYLSSSLSDYPIITMYFKLRIQELWGLSVQSKMSHEKYLF